MNSLLRLLAGLLLALWGSACASSSLFHWAADHRPRGEVLAFVDREGVGDGLLVRFSGEPGIADGVYWLEAASSAAQGTPPPVAGRLGAEQEQRVLGRARRGGRTARLDRIDSPAQVDWVLIDVYRGPHLEAPWETPAVAPDTEPVAGSGPRYYLSLVRKARNPADGAPCSLAAVHVRRGVREEYEDRGVFILPPARRVRGRVVPAVLAAPFALALDLVLLPFEVAAFLLFTSDVAASTVDIGGGLDL